MCKRYSWYFILICGLQSREGWGEAWRKVRGLNCLVESDIQKNAEVQNFGNEGGEPSPVPLLFTSLDPPWRTPGEYGWSDINVIILKRMGEFFLSKQWIYII